MLSVNLLRYITAVYECVCYKTEKYCNARSTSLLTTHSRYGIAAVIQYVPPEPAERIMQGIIDLHVDIMFMLIFISAFVIWMMARILIGAFIEDDKEMPYTPISVAEVWVFFKTEWPLFRYSAYVALLCVAIAFVCFEALSLLSVSSVECMGLITTKTQRIKQILMKFPTRPSGAAVHNLCADYFLMKPGVTYQENLINMIRGQVSKVDWQDFVSADKGISRRIERRSSQDSEFMSFRFGSRHTPSNVHEVVHKATVLNEYRELFGGFPVFGLDIRHTPKIAQTGDLVVGAFDQQFGGMFRPVSIIQMKNLVRPGVPTFLNGGPTAHDILFGHLRDINDGPYHHYTPNHLVLAFQTTISIDMITSGQLHEERYKLHQQINLHYRGGIITNVTLLHPQERNQIVQQFSTIRGTYQEYGLISPSQFKTLTPGQNVFTAGDGIIHPARQQNVWRGLSGQVHRDAITRNSGTIGLRVGYTDLTGNYVVKDYSSIYRQ